MRVSDARATSEITSVTRAVAAALAAAAAAAAVTLAPSCCAAPTRLHRSAG